MKTALVTGASRGIGREVALRLAKDGYRVIVHCVNNTDKANEVKALIESAGGVCEVTAFDLKDSKNAGGFAKSLGDIDVLVLNASIQYKKGWQDITYTDCVEQLNCNFISSLMIIQAVTEHMKAQGFGRIVTVGSVQEAKPHPDMLVYSASKSAQTNMVRSLALQLAPFGITVNNVAPGVINTDRNVEALSDPEYAKKVTSLIPAGFYGEATDCAGIVSLICSDEGRYITGQSIYVDGGKSL